MYSDAEALVEEIDEIVGVSVEQASTQAVKVGSVSLDGVTVLGTTPDSPSVREVRVGPGKHFAQALVVPPMACGVGACQGCAVQVERGVRLACTDGPVFDLLELR